LASCRSLIGNSPPGNVRHPGFHKEDLEFFDLPDAGIFPEELGCDSHSWRSLDAKTLGSDSAAGAEVDPAASASGGLRGGHTASEQSSDCEGGGNRADPDRNTLCRHWISFHFRPRALCGTAEPLTLHRP